MEKLFDLDVQVKSSIYTDGAALQDVSQSCFCSILTDCWKQDPM
ncbi:hypothetical protein [Tumebacillus permanentifrigoris]|uniref:Uncharacterized protein n=1 Tax=Tumebacillus permanentifrigoris TaxID=378543 RepID=A0A316DBA1_9BACL|nr:hypothetical protein [Tumebacillus permanentifrigoris]PWK15008.1 hypothetical protein C7459_104214 [Tumebacillus permanentifrigoris]